MIENCPHVRIIRSGDESMDYCKESDRFSGMRVCLLVGGDKCDEWEEIKQEWENENGS